MSTDDLRLGDVILDGDEGDVVLLGFPNDEGVRRNAGRVGAREGPKVFRQLLKRTGTVVNAEFDDLDLRKYVTLSDGGNIAEDLSLEEAHRQLEERVTLLIAKGKIPFVVGGGNDQSYPNASGLLNNLAKDQSVVVINIDAHLDVRPLKEGNKAHSGSPFRQLLEDRRFSQNPRNRFIEFACQGCQCSIEHVNYLRSKRPLAELFWFNEIRSDPREAFEKILKEVEKNGSLLFVSFDIDSIISASCPGVSAPATYGLSADDALHIALLAGQSPQVKLFDLSEFNPVVEDYRTGKLVTLIFYHFLLGRAIQRRNQSL